MEAADDIAYCISDLEDAFDKRIISPVDMGKALGVVIKRNNASADITLGRAKLTNE
jgi:dGTP triphosphohydrolase